MAEFKWLQFGEGHTSSDVCKVCKDKGKDVPATGVALIAGWFPVYACDEDAEMFRKTEAAAIAEQAEAKFAANDFLA